MQKVPASHLGQGSCCENHNSRIFNAELVSLTFRSGFLHLPTFLDLSARFKKVMIKTPFFKTQGGDTFSVKPNMDLGLT